MYWGLLFCFKIHRSATIEKPVWSQRCQFSLSDIFEPLGHLSSWGVLWTKEALFILFVDLTGCVGVVILHRYISVINVLCSHTQFNAPVYQPYPDNNRRDLKSLKRDLMLKSSERRPSSSPILQPCRARVGNVSFLRQGESIHRTTAIDFPANFSFYWPPERVGWWADSTPNHDVNSEHFDCRTTRFATEPPGPVSEKLIPVYSMLCIHTYKISVCRHTCVTCMCEHIH